MDAQKHKIYMDRNVLRVCVCVCVSNMENNELLPYHKIKFISLIDSFIIIINIHTYKRICML